MSEARPGGPVIDPMAEPWRRLAEAVGRAARAVGAPDDFRAALERPRDPAHGDVASNAALVLGGRMGRPPLDVAEAIRAALHDAGAPVASVEVAGPGFLNFRFDDSVYWDGLAAILRAGRRFGRRSAAEPLRVNVEFVSANPTGPLHVAHGRGAALGDAVASLLEWTGHEVVREYYVNDAGRQIDLLGASVEARYQELLGRDSAIPEGGYHGAYVRELAVRLRDEAQPGALQAMGPDERATWFAERASALLRLEHEEDLAAFGVRMETWSQESRLYAGGAIEGLLDRLAEAELTYEDDGATWLATSRFGDEKDRVLVKSDGSYTYFLPDIAYHLDKAERGFDRAIDVWGADHHGHVARMKAALEALGLPPDFLEVLILQLVTVMRGGEEVRMSKRAGTFVTLRELYDETGPDVARYFFLMRRAEVPLSFDLDLALDRSDANPVYKVQYAHARMCSVFARGGVDPGGIDPSSEDLSRLGTEHERALARTLARFPEVVDAAAAARAPYQVCGYLEEAAGLANAWYHTGNQDPSLRVLAEGPARAGRLALARAVQVTLRNGLELLGLSAPERMERQDDDEEEER
ncbi:MAG: arginine--tRNA ligase [Candidatus Palauibacterales bacterium]|nr:arginine--tRNA ligase [Candidatus Palauibacterales bacterium]MDP2530186.1 arginine--tRNA ligase [Candidatus Palauibacterales bacterium]MDP2584571.1 arginine--tRNA ligase [Candidatus Palauibacterales bacterium]